MKISSASLIMLLGLLAVSTGCAQENLPPPVNAAIADLAQHMNVAADKIVVVGLEEVTWPDASLGCPEPGKLYAQVLVKGYKVTLEAAGHRFEYHTDMLGRAVRVTGAPVATTTSDAGRPDVVDKAVADLSARLGVEAGKIEVVSCEEQMWPDGSLDLPEPGMVYTKAIVSGYLVVLGANDRQYEYHCSKTAARLAGVHIPDNAVSTLLCMRRTEPLDGNNFFELVRMDPTVGGQTEQVFPFLSGFAATPDGRSLAVIVRTSRSSFSLMLPREGDKPQEIDSAFEFGGVAWNPLGDKLAWWKRPTIMQREESLQIYDVTDGSRHSIVPKVEGDWSPGGMAWTLDGLVFTIDIEGEGTRALFWDGEQTTQIGGGYDVLGWIPATRCVLVSRAGDDGGRVLSALRVPNGEPVKLVEAPDVLSASALRRQQAVLAILKGEDGRLALKRVSWGGVVEDLMPVPGKDDATVSAAPTGDLATLSYVGPEDVVIEVLRLGDELMRLFKLKDCVDAEPVMR
ncbi:MAG: hypothetical protein J7M38_12560 [Armatimonadetes bacterium]|nr:hypothetical protein [Armatimonadota bacterium]